MSCLNVFRKHIIYIFNFLKKRFINNDNVNLQVATMHLKDVGKMVKWKLSEKLKRQSEPEPKETTKPETNQESETILAEYHKTLYSENVTSKKDNSHQRENSVLSKQRIWRDVQAIEGNVDSISKQPLETSGTELDKRVDGILANKEKTLKKNERKSRKPSNVIYVVSKPQPGQVRGDWAVRGHGKIYSHHRLKENAIVQARNIARERNATVLIQNTDGTFSEGFKPRPKK